MYLESHTMKIDYLFLWWWWWSNSNWFINILSKIQKHLSYHISWNQSFFTIYLIKEFICLCIYLWWTSICLKGCFFTLLFSIFHIDELNFYLYLCRHLWNDVLKAKFIVGFLFIIIIGSKEYYSKSKWLLIFYRVS